MTANYKTAIQSFISNNIPSTHTYHLLIFIGVFTSFITIMGTPIATSLTDYDNNVAAATNVAVTGQFGHNYIAAAREHQEVLRGILICIHIGI